MSTNKKKKRQAMVHLYLETEEQLWHHGENDGHLRHF